jgi:hypothetical protein
MTNTVMRLRSRVHEFLLARAAERKIAAGLRELTYCPTARTWASATPETYFVRHVKSGKWLYPIAWDIIQALRYHLAPLHS